MTIPNDRLLQTIDRRVNALGVSEPNISEYGQGEDQILVQLPGVEGMALSGRIAVYRGDITGGIELLRMAGPYAGTREEATDRTALLALLLHTPSCRRPGARA
mgnify:CR=1 FL=1